MSATEEAAVDAAPFDLPGDGARAALCLHGLTGTPYEVRPIGEALSRRGIRALGPALPGHGETPEALARVSHRDWLEAAGGHLEALRARHESVSIVGMSMGGVLALALAAREPVSAVVVIGTPLRLRRSLALLVPLLKYVVPSLGKRTGADIRDEIARRRHPSYTVMPLAGVHELLRLQRRVRRELHRVTAPILIAHGVHDRTADPANTRVIFESVRSKQKQLLMLESSAHVCTVDHDGPELARAVADFLSLHA